MEGLGNGSTPLEANSENVNPRLQLANHDASGGCGVQREPADESVAIYMPTRAKSSVQFRFPPIIGQNIEIL